MTELVRHSLVWHNPYTQPPAGMPRVLAEEFLPRGVESVVVARLWFPGCGYSQTWALASVEAPRRLSAAAKGSIRRKSLVRRVTAKAPLFAGGIIAAELEARADYFAGEDVSR